MKKKFYYEDIFADFDEYLRRNQRIVVTDDDGVVRCIKQPDQLDMFVKTIKEIKDDN